jgi:hypothetical protein
MDTRFCLYCKVSFTPNKYSPRQKICSNPECQKKRQLESMKLWRERNPNYFKYDESKGLAWLETQRRRSKVWREKNPDKVRSYRQAHSAQYREYMREYMRQYREKKRVARAGSAPPAADPPPTS